MKVFALLVGECLKISPKGEGGGPIVLRWAVNREQNPRVATFSVQAERAEYRFSELAADKAPAALFPVTDYTLHPEYAVTLTPRGDAVPVWIRPVFNHRPGQGASLISVEFPPEGYTAKANFAHELKGRGNGPFRQVLAAAVNAAAPAGE